MSAAAPVHSSNDAAAISNSNNGSNGPVPGGAGFGADDDDDGFNFLLTDNAQGGPSFGHSGRGSLGRRRSSRDFGELARFNQRRQLLRHAKKLSELGSRRTAFEVDLETEGDKPCAVQVWIPQTILILGSTSERGKSMRYLG